MERWATNTETRGTERTLDVAGGEKVNLGMDSGERKGNRLCGHYSVFPRWPSHRLRQLASARDATNGNKVERSSPGRRTGREDRVYSWRQRSRGTVRENTPKRGSFSSSTRVKEEYTTKTDPTSNVGGLNGSRMLAAFPLPPVSASQIRATGYPSSVRNAESAS